MTYDEMLGSLRSFAKENDITFKDALIGVNKFGQAAIAQFDKVGHADWGAQEFADGIYGITEIFKGDFPAGVNLASIALQTMEKDGQKAFQNLDAGTKEWILSVANDADAFKTVFADLAAQGFTIDTAEFEATLADITASAEFVGANIGQLLSGKTIGEGMRGLGEALKTEIKGALGDSMLGDLFDTTGIATAFQDLFANINDLKSGEMSSGDFMSGMAEAIASGKANLEEYLPRIKAMRDAMAEVEKAVDEAFKPTAAEELAAATEAMAANLKDSFGTGIGAALNAALSEGGSTEAGLAAFGESMRGSIKDSVKNSIVQGMVEAAVLQGPLAEMMATFGQAFKGAISGGISAEEQSMLDAYLTMIGKTADDTIALLEPSVKTVLDLGAAADSTLGKLNGPTVGVPNDPALKQFKADVEEAQATLKSGFSSAVSEAFSMIGQGKSVEEATAAFSESFKTSISSSVAQGLQEALVQSAVMEGALGTMMAQFKEATAAAMADGVITGAEQANLASMAQQIKTTGEAAANALAPVVASVATIATGVAAGTDSVSFNVNANAEASAAAADATISNSATVASQTVATAAESASTTVSDAAAITAEALNSASTTMSGDVTAAAENLKASVDALLGAGDDISQMAPEAAYGIGQSLADVRDKVAPELQTQIDSLIGSLSDASITPEEAATIRSLTATGISALDEAFGGGATDAIAAGVEALQNELDSGRLSGITEPLNQALGSLTSPADNVRDALGRLEDPTNGVTSEMNSLRAAARDVVYAFDAASASLRAGAGTPAAATGGSFASGSAVVGEAGRPELVSSRRGGGFTVTPLTWPQAKHLMHSGTRAMAVGGVVGGGQFGGGGDGTIPPAPTGGGGGGYTPGAEGAEFADFTSAIVEAFRAGFEGSKGFIEDFSDSINESVRSRLVDAIMQGFSESPAIQKYAKNIDTLITKAQELAGNNKLSAEELRNIQTQIKENTDAIGAQADQIDELLEPMRQAEAISTAISDGLDFSGALKSLALNPDDLDGFNRSIDQTVNDAVLNGAIQGLLASGPIQDAIKKFGSTMNDAMATALEDGVLTAEESGALHDLAVSGSAEMKTAMEAMGPVLSALGIDLGDSLSEGVNRAKELLKSASSAMDPFAALTEGQTQFEIFAQTIRDQVYGNIRDGLVQAFIDSAVTNGLLAGPLLAIQAIFDQIGQKQLDTAAANAALAEQIAIINGSLDDPTFKAAFDGIMDSIRSIGDSLGQTSARVTSSATTAVTSAQAVTNASKDVCSGRCALEKTTMELGFAATNTFGRMASVSVERMLPKMAEGGLVTQRTTAIIGEAGPELVIPVSELDTRANIQRLADIAASTGGPSMSSSPSAIDTDRLVAGTTQTVDAIKDLHDRLDKLSDAIFAQPTEVTVQMDRETLMRAMAKADRLKRKARYGATA
jgi:hypothetical protein